MLNMDLINDLSGRDQRGIWKALGKKKENKAVGDDSCGKLTVTWLYTEY